MTKNAKPAALTIHQIANDGDALRKENGRWAKAYTSAMEWAHRMACANTFHSLQYRDDCFHLNTFYSTLKVNDQTAFRVWIGKHFIVPVKGQEKPASLFKFSTDKGFRLTKGHVSEDVFNLDTMLGFRPFYEKNVKDKDAVTLEAILAMLVKATDRADKQATEEGISLPPTLVNDLSRLRDTATSLKGGNTKSNLPMQG